MDIDRLVNLHKEYSNSQTPAKLIKLTSTPKILSGVAHSNAAISFSESDIYICVCVCVCLYACVYVCV